MIPSQILSTQTWISLQYYFLSSFLKLITLPSTMRNHMVQILTNLKRAFDVLLYNQTPFPLPCMYDIPNTTRSEEPIRITRYEHQNEGGDTPENVEKCAVCLGEVEEGEEIEELRCSHVFHKLCLERWALLKRTTCPLCRGPLAPPMIRNSTTTTHEQADFGVEVLFFKFCSFRSEDDHRDSWWLR